ncbi:MAG TPA: Gfo/Idh/MocA family oxidoreductase [Candidatus Solibacter sp.]|nr:Gfo/Idh/MocA family oxidoreductase [Candidatus Solibacter sp.]
MRGLVVGAGSIGRRHLQNLKVLGLESLGVVETDTGRRCAVAAEINAVGFEELQAGLDWRPDFVVVATPTHLHAQQVLSIIEKGLAVFVEKPLSHSVELLDEICRVGQKPSISLVGCNMRFHPGPARVKQLMDEGQVGKILFARIHAGSYLPDWRHGSDYRSNYAAKKVTGGGCLLDCIHEIDLARWYLGEIDSVFCSAGHLSSLEIETEDVASLICRHANAAMSEIHLDYVQRTYERGCQIVGEQGSVFWDFNGKDVRWFNAHSKEWKTYPQPADWEINQMYLDEMRHFLDCVSSRRETMLPIPDAVGLMRVVFAAKDSSEQKRMIEISGERSQ